jgi:hypothetical protein
LPAPERPGRLVSGGFCTFIRKPSMM